MPDRPAPIRILFVDDHPIFRHGVRKLLELEPDFALVGEASAGQEAVQKAAALRPDVVLLDVAMPKLGGLEALPELCTASPTTRVLLLTASIGHIDLLRALQIGARGVLLKEAAARLLPRAIRTLAAGGFWVGPEPVTDLSQALERITAQAPDRRFGLTPRELDIVTAVLAGHNNRDIAERLSISEQTVKHHLTSVFDKLGVSSRLELALFALKHRLTDE